jgi:hypothetical protein
LVQQPKPYLCFGIVVLTIAEVAADAAATAAAMRLPSHLAGRNNKKHPQSTTPQHKRHPHEKPRDFFTRKTQRLTHTKPNRPTLNPKPKPHFPPPKKNHSILPCSCNWKVNQKLSLSFSLSLSLSLSLSHTHTSKSRQQKQLHKLQAGRSATNKSVNEKPKSAFVKGNW